MFAASSRTTFLVYSRARSLRWDSVRGSRNISETSDQVACWKLWTVASTSRMCKRTRIARAKENSDRSLEKGIVPNVKIRPDLGQTFTVYKSSNGSARSVCVCNCPYATIATQQGIREVNLNSCMRHGRKLEDDGSETSGIWNSTGKICANSH